MKIQRALWIAIVLPAILTVTILLSTPQTALTCDQRVRCGQEFYYYSDASHQNIVGARFWDCDCNHYSWGTISPYYENLFATCCG